MPPRVLRVFAVFFHPSRQFTAVGGAEKRFLNVLENWAKERVSVTIVEPSPGLIKNLSISNSQVFELSNVFSCRKKSLLAFYFEWVLWTLKACLTCSFLVKQRRYHVILATNNTVPNLAVAYFVHFVSRVPLCVVVHHLDVPDTHAAATPYRVYTWYRNTNYPRLPAFLKTLAFEAMTFFLKRSNTCIAVSKFTADTLTRRGVSSFKVFVSGNGVNLKAISQCKTGTETKAKGYDAVFVGRISREKGVFDLIRIWKKVVEKKPDSRLAVIGTGPDLEELRKQVKQAGLEGKLVAKGACSDREVYSLMKTSRVFLFPSRFEGWGLAVGEALACGLPVICYQIPALKEVFEGCPAVLFIKKYDWKLFAEKTLETLEKGKTGELARHAKKYSRKFTWKETAKKDFAFLKLTATRRTKPCRTIISV